jgi:hypothetical protein
MGEERLDLRQRPGLDLDDPPALARLRGQYARPGAIASAARGGVSQGLGQREAEVREPVVGGPGGLLDANGPLEQRHRVGRTLLLAGDPPEVVRPPVERERLGVRAQDVMDDPQRVERAGDLGVIGPEQPLADRQRPCGMLAARRGAGVLCWHDGGSMSVYRPRGRVRLQPDTGAGPRTRDRTDRAVDRRAARGPARRRRGRPRGRPRPR